MPLLDILSHARALPEVLLLVGACIAMLADTFVRHERRAPTYWIAQGTLLLCAVATLWVMSETGGEK